VTGTTHGHTMAALRAQIAEAKAQGDKDLAATLRRSAELAAWANGYITVTKPWRWVR
jgi:hypothetical protein